MGVNQYDISLKKLRIWFEHLHINNIALLTWYTNELVVGTFYPEFTVNISVVSDILKNVLILYCKYNKELAFKTNNWNFSGKNTKGWRHKKTKWKWNGFLKELLPTKINSEITFIIKM